MLSDASIRGRKPPYFCAIRFIGWGALEIRIRDVTGALRILYVAKFEEAIFILHCFLKKTKQTSHADIALAIKRYRELKEEQRK